MVWLAVISAVGANAGPGLNSYAYLAGRTSLPSSAGFAVIAGVLTHPNRAIAMIHARLHYVYALLRPVGVVGLASAWGFGVPIVVLLTNVLNSKEIFIFQAFQNFAVYPFVLLGTVMVLVWCGQHLRFGWVPVTIVALALVAQATFYGVTTSPGNVRWAITQVEPAAASTLRQGLAFTPPATTVISSMGVMGLYSSRQFIYVLLPGEVIPVRGPEVVFVLYPPHDVGEMTPVQSAAIGTFIRDHLHASVLAEGNGVQVLRWRPPPGVSQLTLPSAASPS